MSCRIKGAKVQKVFCDDKNKKAPCVKVIRGQKFNFDFRLNFVEIKNTLAIFLLSWLDLVHTSHLNSGACVIHH